MLAEAKVRDTVVWESSVVGYMALGMSCHLSGPQFYSYVCPKEAL